MIHKSLAQSKLHRNNVERLEAALERVKLGVLETQACPGVWYHSAWPSSRRGAMLGEGAHIMMYIGAS
jgi:hypothetical protein